MIVIGSRKRNQPPPPHIVFEALVDPARDPGRPWLDLLDDEQPPRVLNAQHPTRVVWSSLWPKRPDAIIEFELSGDGGGGTAVRWTVQVAAAQPDDAWIGHVRKRMNQLINANLRYTFGQ